MVTITYHFANGLFPELMKNNIDIYGYMAKGVCLDTGRPNDLITANQIMVEKYGIPFFPCGSWFFGVSFGIRHAGIHNARVEKCYIGRNIKAGEGVQIKNSAVSHNY